MQTKTMEATATEGVDLVGSDVDPEAKTRAQQKILDEANQPPAPTKTKTMADTTAEGDALLGDEFDKDAKTRSQVYFDLYFS